MSHIFISYSKKDIDFARRLRALLQAYGFAIWIDETKLTPSARWWSTIERNIIDAAAVIVIMSPNSKESEWVERELLVAEDPDHRKTIFPVLLAGKVWSRLGNLQATPLPAELNALPPEFVQALRQVVPITTPSNMKDTVPGGLRLRAAPPPTAPAREQPQQRSNQKTASRNLLWLLLGGGFAALILVIAAVLIVVLPRINQNRTTTPDVRGTSQFAAGDLTATSTTAAVANSTATFTPLVLPTDSGVIVINPPTPFPTFAATTIPTIEATFAPTDVFVTATATSTPAFVADANLAGYITRYDFFGVPQVLVNSGCFKMGADSTTDNDERPVHEVCITQSFWLDAYEVTNEDYADFIAADGYNISKYWYAGIINATLHDVPADFSGIDQPRIFVSWYEAYAYASWRGCRLPTEAEWEYAARGSTGYLYPWGNDVKYDLANTTEDNNAQTVDVGSYSNATWVGAYDMTGNVFEWVSDWYDEHYYESSLTNDPQGPDSGQYRGLRGGSFEQGMDAAHSANRYWAPPDGQANFVGFRVACPA
ncbi:MAG: SUMF1/EgtB/PvdO family nonheme iron enzyme [Anaerolineae bacterium]|nr:SUMF1/EgtB/PvdO family nonheme iron enzyme [Anaerolineae bacterium]